MQGLLDQMWAHLLPALTAESGPAGPWPAESPWLAGPAGDGDAGEITEAAYRPGPGNTIDELRAVRTGPGRLVVDDSLPLAVALGDPSGWTVTGQVATAWAWSGGELLVDLIFAEGPHRLHLALDPATGTFAASWQAPPLGWTPLAMLHMPPPRPHL